MPHAGEPADLSAAGRGYHAAQRRQTGSSPSGPNPCCWGPAGRGTEDIPEKVGDDASQSPHLGWDGVGQQGHN